MKQPSTFVFIRIHENNCPVPGTHFKLIKFLDRLINHTRNPYLNLTNIMQVFHKVCEGMTGSSSDATHTDDPPV